MNDREAVRQRMAVYARALDDRDYQRLAGCFAEDAEVEYVGFSPLMKGRETIMAHMRKALGPLAVTQHLFGNFIIELNGETASLDCDILAQHLAGTGDERKTFLSGGQYRVRLRREGGRWVFASITACSTWSAGSRDILPRSDPGD